MKLNTMVARFKIYLIRGQGYISIFQFLMILIVTLDTFGLIQISIPIAILLFFVVILVGYLDYSKRVLGAELDESTYTAQWYKNIIGDLKEIKDTLNKMKENNKT